MSSPPTFIHATAVAISLDSDAVSKPKLASGKLCVDSYPYELIEDEGMLHYTFPDVLDLSPSTSITLHYKTGFMGWMEKTHEINTHQLFANFSSSQTQDVHDGIRLVFTCQVAGTETPEAVPTTDSDGTLPLTMGAILKDCPWFRILVIGQPQAGKATLIRAAFGIDDSYSDSKRGRASINVGLQFADNERLILHDSLGFEQADNVDYDTLKKFIQNRQSGPLKDRLHAIWFCIPITRAGAWLPKPADKNFFETKKETLGSIPLVVVYTKLDLTVKDQMSRSALSAEELACFEAESHAKKCSREIEQLAGEFLPYAVVSTEEKYKATLQKLIRMTYDCMGRHDAPKIQIPAGIMLIVAQRVDPKLKIKTTINVGRQRYWKALRASPSFQGQTIRIWNRLHDDIVKVWNFHDPYRYLSDKRFKELIVKMAQEVEAGSVSSPNTNILNTLSGGSLVAAVSGILGATANHAAPIVLPVLGSALVAVWAYGVYRNAKSVQQIFMAYIVDLTRVLETLYILTSCKHKRLTWDAIKFAYDTYRNSGAKTRAHADIQDYRSLNGQGAALEKIESLIEPELGGNVNEDYYARVRRIDLATLDLDQEGWP